MLVLTASSTISSVFRSKTLRQLSPAILTPINLASKRWILRPGEVPGDAGGKERC